MNPLYFGWSAVVAYIAATFVLVRSSRTDFILMPSSLGKRLPLLALGWVAAGLHLSSLLGMCDRAGAVNFSFMSASSLAALGIVLLFLLTALVRPVDKLGVIIFPLASAIALLKIVLPEEAHTLKVHAWQMNVHILASMLAYSFLNIAALQALLVAFQDWNLHRHHATGFVKSLPPLQTMEKLLFQLIGAGFLLLSLSLLSGFVFLEDLFAQHLVHKTVLSITAWLIFAVVLWGRFQRGWRGQTAIRWTLGGFAALMLAYFGTKMVLEWILHKA
ncbi:inner membrane protein YpjD [Methylococcus sp. EFPC2]|uniref:cytochrome C assembly family protein n=1 Tax=Methylococcus sp. EFPC2 TaxID=2812648 RepID=UPI001967154B|nr:cytochrome c biogenesis protein CcsA [Methylococcus sp. EFPC2]QSA95863.1 cytochrome c biogenesis protein CcsA [Methylococcus sp. EFPC2]